METVRVDELLMDVRDNLLRAKPDYHINISFAADMFYRGSSHENSGHGIGMTMVQRILTLHDADIFVSSKEGHGTIFTTRFMKN